MKLLDPLRAAAFGAFRSVASRLGGRGYGLARIPGVMRLFDLLYSRLRPSGTVLARVRGQRMYVRPESSHLAASLITTGDWEKRETEVFMAAIEPGMTVLDLGANIGYYTLIAAQLVGPSGRVIAFEPDPANYDLLVKNVAVNGHTNVTAIRAAVADEAKRAPLYLDHGHWGESLAEQNISGSVGWVEVDVVTLDGVVRDKRWTTPVGLMKIDVQGAEGLVLRGGRGLFERDLPRILMELEPDRLRTMATEPLDLLRDFEALGYRIQPIDERAAFDAPISLDRLVSLAEETGIINVFLTPGPRAG